MGVLLGEKFRYKLRLNGCQLLNTKSRVFAASGHVFSRGEKFQGKPLGPRFSRVPEWNAKFNTRQHRLVHCSLFYTAKFWTPQLTQQRWVRPITWFISSTRFPLLLCFCLSTVEPPGLEQAGQNMSGAETVQFALVRKVSYIYPFFPATLSVLFLVGKELCRAYIFKLNFNWNSHVFREKTCACTFHEDYYFRHSKGAPSNNIYWPTGEWQRSFEAGSFLK